MSQSHIEELQGQFQFIEFPETDEEPSSDVVKSNGPNIGQYGSVWDALSLQHFFKQLEFLQFVFDVLLSRHSKSFL